MGSYWGGQNRARDARISCVHHPKKVRTWQARRSLAMPVDTQHITLGLCVAQDGAAGIWSPSALASAELAVAELNQRNGIAGRQVRLV